MNKAWKKIVACTLAAAVVLAPVSVSQAAVGSNTNGLRTENKKNVTAKKTNGVTPIVDTKKNGTATFKAVKKTSKKSVTVSSTVTVKGVKYTVTTIGAKAFSKAPKAKKVTLPATVKTISKNAFTGAKKLKTIVLKGKKSIKIKKGAFKGLKTKKMTIKVNKKMSKKELKKLKKALKKAGFKGKVKK